MIMSSTESSTTQFEVQKDTLVRYVEVWIPTDEGNSLRLVSAQSTVAKGSQRITIQDCTVAMGEGVAGTAWEQRSAAIVSRHDAGQLDRINSRSESDLAAVLAIPVFFQQEIRGVVVIGLGDGFGAVEVWNRDDRDELAVSASHYAGLKSFEFISRYTRFPKGAGVPGRVWQSGLPYLLQNLGHSDTFIRSFGNDEADISAAIGLPIGHVRGFPDSVLLLLSSSATPLASLAELWECESLPVDESESPSTRILSATNAGGDVQFDAGVTPQAWQSALLKMTVAAGQPILVTTAEAELPAGARFVLSIPLFRNDTLRSVLNLMF